MTGNTTLLPCPFCGSLRLTQESTSAMPVYGINYQDCWIECDNCGCNGPIVTTNDGPDPVPYQAVREAWNNRGKTIITVDNAVKIG